MGGPDEQAAQIEHLVGTLTHVGGEFARFKEGLEERRTRASEAREARRSRRARDRRGSEVRVYTAEAEDGTRELGEFEC